MFASRILVVGPTCNREAPYLKFDLERATQDEIAGTEFLRSNGATEEQLDELQPPPDFDGSIRSIQAMTPQSLPALCHDVWAGREYQRYEVGRTVTTLRSPPEISDAMVKAEVQEQAREEAERAAERPKEDALEQEAARAAADAAAAFAESAKRR